jgi:hypothetical protein
MISINNKRKRKETMHEYAKKFTKDAEHAEKDFYPH